MDLGIHVASFTWPDSPRRTAETLKEVAAAADEGGFAWLSVMDHFFQMDQYFEATEPMLEGYTTLGYLAGVTDRVKLGLLVTGVTYRYPGILAKTVTTLDVLSGGRGMLGIGAAWYQREHDGLGVPYPSMSDRFEQLEETLQICKQMWAGDTSGYKGSHFELAETLNSPQPISRPHPPIMIGGSGEKKTLRLVGKYADACNLFVNTPEEATHKLEVLRRHCENEGTDYDAITKTMLYAGMSHMSEDLTGLVDELTALAGAGIEGAYIMPFGPDPVGLTERLATEVVPRVAEV